MYLVIQILAGFPELEIATFAKMLRCFEISGNTGFGRFPGARNRDFREEVPPLSSTGKYGFSRLPRSISRILLARDSGDAAGQTYPLIERSVSGPPVRPIVAFRVGIDGSAGLEIGAFRIKFNRFMVRKWRILADSPDSELVTPHQRIPLF